MKPFSWLALLLITSQAQGQSADVLQKLKMFHLQTADFVQNLQAPDTTLSFNYTHSVTSEDSTSIEEGAYDPSRPLYERWALLYKNGKSPSKAEKATFSKTNGANPHQPPVMVNDTTLDTDVEGNFLIVPFRLKPETVPERLAFLNNCTGKAYIRMSNGKLEKVAYNSTKEVIYHGIKAAKLRMEVSFEYVSTAKAYRAFMEEVDITTNLSGPAIEIQEVREFKDYRKIE